MGCMGTKQQQRVVRHEHSLTIDERQPVDLSKFAKALSKRTTSRARPSNYQTTQLPLRPPAYKEGKPIAAVDMQEWTIPARAEQRVYKVPKVAYPRLELSMPPQDAAPRPQQGRQA